MLHADVVSSATFAHKLLPVQLLAITFRSLAQLLLIFEHEIHNRSPAVKSKRLLSPPANQLSRLYLLISFLNPFFESANQIRDIDCTSSELDSERVGIEYLHFVKPPPTQRPYKENVLDEPQCLH